MIPRPRLWPIGHQQLRSLYTSRPARIPSGGPNKPPVWSPNPSAASLPRLSASFRRGRKGAAKGQSATVTRAADLSPTVGSAPPAGIMTHMLETLLPDLASGPILDTQHYRRLTAQDAAKEKRPPKGTQMLVRDFVDDCLYNPHYGYFSKQASIYTAPAESFDIPAMRDSLEFMDRVADRYREMDGGGAPHSATSNRVSRQVWHTPTELFNPWFGNAIANYIVTEYKLHHYPEDDLIIYEMGAGNGTLMTNIMNYLRDFEPQVYERTRYNIIEISPQLAERQASHPALRAGAAHHRGVHFINRSVLDWDTVVPQPCFFLAMEVLDNFAHDLIRYDPITERPYQGTVLTDPRGEYQEAFEAVHDPLIARYLRLRRQTGYVSPLFSRRARWFRHLRQHFPLPPNLTGPEFIPTRALQLLEVLRDYFPQHRLVVSDFYSLPDTVPGVDGPVVQTRYRETMVPCSTYLVQPGWFDIFFPTNFELLRDMYLQVCGCATPDRHVRVRTQREFLEHYADLEHTTTSSGESPLLDYYENNKFLLS
ncbi:hypothetical protein IWQ60_011898 [Tieghemiomyces parasiticus]|uniref:Protein arginine methyltransferase NDUFAF7 n=1 Tax=Tieghemiomyces parasiticus TaxID=78921 RepID=A0A9W8DL41_9FUNG|nr:hypothetical protein IWQ60_011898 [Tieghemiomyces parasiticus]